MTNTRTYPNGVPCWIDTEQPDVEAASRFYGGVFGWTFRDAMPPGASAAYLIAQLAGEDVAAIGPSAGAEARWNTYVAVADVDATVARAEALGAETIMPPQDAGAPGPDRAGRAAAFVDLAGAELRLWQPGTRLGAQLVNVAGTWNFSDLHTAHPASVLTFYERIFGWETADVDMGDGVPSTLWRQPGYGDHQAATTDPDIHARHAAVAAPPGFADAVAWLAPLDGDEPPHWHVTFAVADRDDAVATAVGLGATDLSGPVDTRWTRLTRLRDPQGAVFTVSQFSPPA